jgi:hypothetical protein
LKNPVNTGKIKVVGKHLGKHIQILGKKQAKSVDFQLNFREKKNQ